MRGDVPALAEPSIPRVRFSPHARGCSLHACRYFRGHHVFPACAGMFRAYPSPVTDTIGFPRMRGDVPVRNACSLIRRKFSPHARGCSFHSLRTWSNNVCFPRMRGDVPSARHAAVRSVAFSPHARGCSDGFSLRYLHDYVFPAYAGMFLVVVAWAEVAWGFLRIRGDVPPWIVVVAEVGLFSPHTRGCSRGSGVPAARR